MKHARHLKILAIVLIVSVVSVLLFSHPDSHSIESDPNQATDKRVVMERLAEGAGQPSRNNAAVSIAESDFVKNIRKPIFAKIDELKAEFEEDFVPEKGLGPGRGSWRNSKHVRFWTENLDAEDPELSLLAIKIVENSVWGEADLLRDRNGANREAYTQEEWESHQIFTAMLRARGLISGTRNSVPTWEAVIGGDADDSLILKDAAPILRVFVPRLGHENKNASKSARSVINLFTFDLFRDESEDWWKEWLRHQDS